MHDASNIKELYSTKQTSVIINNLRYVYIFACPFIRLRDTLNFSCDSPCEKGILHFIWLLCEYRSLIYIRRLINAIADKFFRVIYFIPKYPFWYGINDSNNKISMHKNKQLPFLIISIIGIVSRHLFSNKNAIRVIITMIIDHLFIIWLYYKANRCLARYSPRATTTNQPTNSALIEMCLRKLFLGKKS